MGGSRGHGPGDKAGDKERRGAMGDQDLMVNLKAWPIGPEVIGAAASVAVQGAKSAPVVHTRLQRRG